MQRIIISKEYPEEFVRKYLPALFFNIAKRETLQYQQSRMNDYLNKTYKISIVDVIPYLKKVRVDAYRDNYILYLDSEQLASEDAKIREILHVVNNGNIEVRGLNIIDKSLDYLIRNMARIYQLYCFTHTHVANSLEKEK